MSHLYFRQGKSAAHPSHVLTNSLFAEYLDIKSFISRIKFNELFCLVRHHIFDVNFWTSSKYFLWHLYNAISFSSQQLPYWLTFFCSGSAVARVSKRMQVIHDSQRTQDLILMSIALDDLWLTFVSSILITC